MAGAGSYSITIVGCGPGASDLLTGTAGRAIQDAEVLAGSAHLLDIFAGPAHERITVGMDIKAALDAVDRQRKKRKVAVLVSGDPGLCSLGMSVLRRFGRDACEVIPGISSIQLAFARLGLDWLEARIISAHKEIPRVSAAELAGCRIIVILAGHRRSREWICRLAEDIGEDRILVLCEDLSLEQERIRRVSIPDLRDMDISSRSIVLILKEDVFSWD